MSSSASADIPRLYRPTWAEINLRALRANLRKIRARTKTPVMLVVKANGYGHGAAQAALAAAPLCAWFGVSSVEEGVALREAGIKRPILILGSLYPFESTMAAIRYGLTPTVASLEGARLIARAAATVSSFSSRKSAELACHLKIDTGMGRVGVRWPAGLEAARYLKEAPGVRLEGVFTHLARAESDDAFSRAQLARFSQALRDVSALGIRLKWRHAANSAAALRLPASRYDLVRPGLAAYGLMPGFEPVLSVKTRIVFIKSVPAGAWLSYGAHYRTKRPARVATLPIGYGDGLHRSASLNARRPMSVLVGGKPCPIVGAMTMDLTLVDVTGVPRAQVGDEAVLMGTQARAVVGAGDWAERAGTIPYEILSHLHSRIPRVYIG